MYAPQCIIMAAFFLLGPGLAVLFRQGPAMLASVLFHRPGRPMRPKVGPAVDFVRYRPRPRPALFVFANGVGKRCAR